MTMKEAISNININEEALLRRFSGNRALMEKYIRKFPEDKTYHSLANSLEEKNYEEMLKAAHTLKGIAANLGFDKLYESCSKMVENLRTGQREDALQNSVDIVEEYQNIVNCLACLDD